MQLRCNSTGQLHQMTCVDKRWTGDGEISCDKGPPIALLRFQVAKVKSGTGRGKGKGERRCGEEQSRTPTSARCVGFGGVEARRGVSGRKCFFKDLQKSLKFRSILKIF